VQHVASPATAGARSCTEQLCDVNLREAARGTKRLRCGNRERFHEYGYDLWLINIQRSSIAHGTGFVWS
jgi:hypothetical protein